MKSNHQYRVEDFMFKAGQEIPNKPKEELSRELRRLRAMLIIEEAFEIVEKGLGIKMIDCATRAVLDFEKIEFWIEHKMDIIETIDGACDLKVVTTGLLVALGLEDEPFQEIVDHNNLKKFGKGSYKDAHGKWHKPPDFVGPTEELKIELERQTNPAYEENNM